MSPKTKSEMLHELESLRAERQLLAAGMVGCAEELARMVLCDSSSGNHDAARFILRKVAEFDVVLDRISALARATMTAPDPHDGDVGVAP